MNDLFDLTTEEIKKGFYQQSEAGRHICAVCGREFENGEIFKVGPRFFDACKMAEIHVREDHGGMLAALMSFDKRYTGLTENQKDLLTLLQSGLSDREIAEKTGTAPATVRHQRFAFKEKAKQAKLYLSIYELAVQNRCHTAKATDEEEEFIDIHGGAKMVGRKMAQNTGGDNN